MCVSCDLDNPLETKELNDIKWIKDLEKGNNVMTENISDNSLQSIHVEYTSGVFRLNKSENSQAYVEYEITSRGANDKNAEITVTQSEGNCNIKFSSGKILEGNCVYYINLYLPEKLINNIKVEMKNGKAYIADASCGKLTVGAQGGEIIIENTSAEDVTLSSVSGDIIFSGHSTSMYLETTSGNISAQLDVMPQKLICDVTSGFITAAFPDSEDGYRITFTRGSGVIKSDFANEKTLSMWFEAGTAKYKQGKGSYFADATSGTIYLKKIN